MEVLYGEFTWGIILKNINPRNVVIKRVAAEVDTHFSRDDFCYYRPFRNVILIYYTEHYSFIFYHFSSNHGAESSKDSTMRIWYELMK